MKKIYKCLAMMAMANVFALSAQESNTLYFLDKNPTVHQLNPAYRPDGRFYIGMPGMSSLYFGLGNNCLTFEDVFQGKTVNGEKQTVSFLSRYADNGIDNFLDALNDNLRVYTDYNVTLLSFGFQVKQKHYVTFGLSNRADIQLSLPKALPEVLLKGNSDVNARKSFDIDNLSAVASLYTEVALGYSQQFDDKLSFGGKLKVLLGHANLHTDFKDMSLTIDKDEWKLTGDGSVDMAMPGLVLTTAADGTLDDTDFSTDDLAVGDLINGMGGAVDLGATYKLLPELTLSASVLDLGFIRWNNNLNALQKERDFVFNGVVYEITDRDTVNYADEYEDILKHMYRVDSKVKAYNSWLTAKVLLAAEYGVWDNRMTFGLLSKTSFLQSKMYEEMMLSANFKPWRIFSAALSYSLLDGEWSNLGFAANFNFGPVNYFLALDQIPLNYAKGGSIMLPTKTRGANFSMGWNYVFGYKAKKEKGEPEGLETLPQTADSLAHVDSVATVVDSLPAVAETTADSIVAVVNDTLMAADSVAISDSMMVVDSVAVTDSVVVDSMAVLPVADSLHAVPVDTVVPEKFTSELIPEALYGIKFAGNELMLLDPSCYPLLDKIAQRMVAEPNIRLSIRGHFHLDERGPEFSRFMTRERTRMIRGYLEEKGVSIDRVNLESVGGDEPIGSNYTKNGQAKNRRIEMYYIK